MSRRLKTQGSLAKLKSVVLQVIVRATNRSMRLKRPLTGQRSKRPILHLSSNINLFEECEKIEEFDDEEGRANFTFNCNNRK